MSRSGEELALKTAEIRELTKAVRALSAGSDHYRRVLAKNAGVSYTATLALGHLYARGPMMPRELAAELELTTGSITAVVDRLCEAGYAERTANPDDRRSSYVQLTAAGRDVIAAGYRVAEQAVATAMRHLDRNGLLTNVDPAHLARLLFELGSIMAQAE